MTSTIAYVRRYAIAFAVALLLHVTLFVSLQAAIETLAPEADRTILEPRPLKARLIRMRPQVAVPAVSSDVIAPQTSEADDEKKASDAIDLEDELTQLERLKKEREARLAELRSRAFRDAIGEELTAETLEAIEDVSQVYITEIYLAIVQNWSRPPSARNDMSAIVLVELFPTGDLNSVGVIESSGDAAFDRSALNAVRRAAPFAVPDDLALFEASFRSFTLNFKPQDLLR
ncbi:MAG: cell envelope integrity protein TolA [Gammaproteobacteria bacterium]|nr:cell envelope integrity protein TolA [Gammaproteobacteria bacterium]